MLVLSRKQGERVLIGPDVVVTLLEARDGRVRLGFEAPAGVPIHREEVRHRITQSAPSRTARSKASESFAA
jgi:carbon storage regulator